MRVLVDTHVLLWVASQPEALSPEAASALLAPHHEVLVSAATAWELAFKVATGKLRLPTPPASWFPEALERFGFGDLDVLAAHALAAGALPPLHRDPFDRMLVAQAAVDGLVLVTRDAALARYGIQILQA